MGVDCSMILRDDSLRQLKTLDEKIQRIRSVEDFLIKKYGIANRDDAIEYELLEDEHFLQFNFEPYGIVSINLYDGFWEIETAWRYHSYFSSENGPSGLPDYFFDIAQDFGCDDAYICSEYCAYNGGELESHSFEGWLELMRQRNGDIPEITPETRFGGYDKGFPGVFHESFLSQKKTMAELSEKAASLGYSANGISRIGWHFITVSKNEKVYVMNRDTFTLLIPDPVDFWMDLNCSSFEVVTMGKTMLFACDGQKLFEADKGHFNWAWGELDPQTYRNTIRVFNEETGQEVFVGTELLPGDGPDEFVLYQTYRVSKRNDIIPMIRA